MKKSAKVSALAWISGVAGVKKLYIVFLVLIHIVQGGCSVGWAVVLKQVVDDAVSGNRQKFATSICWLIGLIAVQILLSAVNKYLDEYALATLENSFKSRLFGQLLNKDYATVTAKHSGEWMNRLTSDTVVVADGLTHILPGIAGMLVKLFGALALIILYLPKVAYVIVPGGILLLVITYGIRRVMKKLHKSVQESDGRLRVFLQENLGSMMVVRAFAKEEDAVAGATEKLIDHKNARMKRNAFSNMCNVGFVVVMNGVYVLCVGVCCYGILNGDISYGTLMAIIQLVGQIQSPLANITGVLPKYYSMTASAERLMEVEDYKEDNVVVKGLEEINNLYDNEFQAISIKNGAFSYISDDEEKTLTDINIEINKGEFVALTGPSGCGKSTLLKLLMCLYPLDEGERILSVANENVELNGSYKRLFAYVPQGNHLMSGSIREVVAFFDKNLMKDDSKINKALEIACASEFVGELKEGLDTTLGERGCGLSEGQMQRIAIARAIFSDCPVLLLDEATSALDERAEKQVLENIRSMTEKTVVIVTHRPAALEICDRRIEM